MKSEVATVFLTFPPRSLGDGERETVRQWRAGTTDIAAAYASERRGDDPAHYRRIVIVETGQQQPSFLVHCPEGTNAWLVTTLGDDRIVRIYDSLRAALNAIRPGLTEPDTETEDHRTRPDWMGPSSTAPTPVSGGPARTGAETAAALRRPRGVDSAVGAPRRKLF